MVAGLTADEIARIKSLSKAQANAERRSLRIAIMKASDACLGIGVLQDDPSKRFGLLPEGAPPDAKENMRRIGLTLKQFDEARKAKGPPGAA
jgi:hypothetical protein